MFANIAGNIRYGRPSLSDADICAAQAANLHEFVMSWRGKRGKNWNHPAFYTSAVYSDTYPPVLDPPMIEVPHNTSQKGGAGGGKGAPIPSSFIYHPTRD